MNGYLIGRVTDATPASLGYGEHRGWVAVDSDTGECWHETATKAEAVTWVAAKLGGEVRLTPVLSDEYDPAFDVETDDEDYTVQRVGARARITFTPDSNGLPVTAPAVGMAIRLDDGGSGELRLYWTDDGWSQSSVTVDQIESIEFYQPGRADG